MQLAAEKRCWTLDEYLEMERASPVRHELLDGVVYAMAGASAEHNQVVANLIAALVNALGQNCDIYGSQMSVRIPDSAREEASCPCPDVTLLCGEPEFYDGKRDVLVNPDTIFEVLSPGTEKYDRTDKFRKYRRIPSLADYVLVSSDQMLVERFRRRPDGDWTVLDPLGADDMLKLPCGEIAIRDLYRRV